jgi:hypothetical protein
MSVTSQAAPSPLIGGHGVTDAQLVSELSDLLLHRLQPGVTLPKTPITPCSALGRYCRKRIFDISAIVDKRKRFLDLHFLGQSAILKVGSKGNQILSVLGTIRRKSAFFDSIGHQPTCATLGWSEIDRNQTKMARGTTANAGHNPDALDCLRCPRQKHRVPVPVMPMPIR